MVVLGIIGLLAGVGIYLTVLKLDIAIIRLNRTTIKFASRWSAGGSMPLRDEADFYPFEDEDATNKLKRVVDSRIFPMLSLNVARVFQALLDKAGPIVDARKSHACPRSHTTSFVRLVSSEEPSAAERRHDLFAASRKTLSFKSTYGEENLKELFCLFLPMDADAESGIRKKELQRAIEALELDVDDGTIEDLFKQFDTNQDNVISFDEFRTMMTAQGHVLSPSKPQQQDLRRIFPSFDTDKKGFMNLADLKRIRHDLGRNDKSNLDLLVNDDVLNAIVDLGDPSSVDGNGKLTEAQFIELVMMSDEAILLSSTQFASTLPNPRARASTTAIETGQTRRPRSTSNSASFRAGSARGDPTNSVPPQLNIQVI